LARGVGRAGKKSLVVLLPREFWDVYVLLILPNKVNHIT
jgi:hypothetical protein